MICSFVLAMPTVEEGAKQGFSVFYWLMNAVPMPAFLKVLLYIGIVVANFLCALAGLTSLLADDLRLRSRRRISGIELAASRQRGVSHAGECDLGGRGSRLPYHALHAEVLDPGGRLRDLPVPLLRSADRGWIFRRRKELDEEGPVPAWRVLQALCDHLRSWVRCCSTIAACSRPMTPWSHTPVVLLVIMAVVWFGLARTRFPGPPIGDLIAKRQAEIAAEEKAVGEAARLASPIRLRSRGAARKAAPRFFAVPPPVVRQPVTGRL